ncbi:MAG: amidohydrolase family protein [Bdellovibrionales bacterium]|nr:amidohydrolase family protein [Bdellovibrionales bacterium]
MAKGKQTIIRATEFFDGRKRLSHKTIVIEGDRIVDILSKRIKPHFEGIVTPAFIDAHSHIGMSREGEPGQEGETNDFSHQIQPLNDPLNSVYFDDRAFQDAVDFGVLYSCIIPGSGNLFGGRAKIIRNFARHRREAEIADYGYKMALGWNPRSTVAWKGPRPNTRMGLYSMLEERFDELLAKAEKAVISRERQLFEIKQKSQEKGKAKDDLLKQQERVHREFELSMSTEELAILEALSGERPIKVHVHKEDDALYLLELKQKYDLWVTAEHMGDVHHKEIFQLFAKEGVSIIYGPLGCLGYKTELSHSFYQNVKLLMESRATFGLMTDHPVIHASLLRDSLRYFLMYGMTSEQAIGLITRVNAEILGLDELLGTVEVGKLASLLIWNRDPLHLSAIPQHVLAEGVEVRRFRLQSK